MSGTIVDIREPGLKVNQIITVSPIQFFCFFCFCFVYRSFVIIKLK